MTMSEPGQTETLFRNIRNTPAFRQLIPQEAGVSWPLASRRDGKPYATFAFFPIGVAERGPGPRVLGAPFASMTMNWDTGRVVEYRDLGYDRDYERPAEPVGTFPHDGVKGMSRSEYLEQRSELFSLYDELFRRLGAGEPIEGPWVERFQTLLGRLVEPGLVPHLRQLSKGFVDRFLAGAADPVSTTGE